jgi:hypothetical protein
MRHIHPGSIGRVELYLWWQQSKGNTLYCKYSSSLPRSVCSAWAPAYLCRCHASAQTRVCEGLARVCMWCMCGFQDFVLTLEAWSESGEWAALAGFTLPAQQGGPELTTVAKCSSCFQGTYLVAPLLSWVWVLRVMYCRQDRSRGRYAWRHAEHSSTRQTMAMLCMEWVPALIKDGVQTWRSVGTNL